MPSAFPRVRRIGIVSAIVLVALTVFLWTTSLFDRDPVHLFPGQGRRAPVSALLFSGDMGMRYGMSPVTARLLASRGIEVVGFNSPALFRTRRTLPETQAIVADAVRVALARTGSDRLVLIGQSYGADVLQTGLAALPHDLRAHIAAIILIVPGETVFLRVDLSSLVYHGTPDSLGAATANTLNWAPLTCIYGIAESDSLCPRLRLTDARIVRMPGGHFLDHDGEALGRQVIEAIATSVPVLRRLSVPARPL